MKEVLHKFDECCLHAAVGVDKYFDKSRKKRAVWVRA
jgi:hypothetical protein